MLYSRYAEGTPGAPKSSTWPLGAVILTEHIPPKGNLGNLVAGMKTVSGEIRAVSSFPKYMMKKGNQWSPGAQNWWWEDSLGGDCKNNPDER